MKSGKRTKLRKILRWAVVLFSISAFAVVVAANNVIEKETEHLVFDHIDSIPRCNAGLLLGTSKYLANGQRNLYFAYRIQAASELYKSQKINCLVVSGDNGTKHYNEPQSMKNELIKAGVPDSVIYLDYAGFRTYDSVIRMNKIFGQSNFIVISQKFHNQRAVYIARRLGINGVGFNAKNVDKYSGFKTNLREKFARVKVFLDLLTNKQPKFLGEPVEIKSEVRN